MRYTLLKLILFISLAGGLHMSSSAQNSPDKIKQSDEVIVKYPKEFDFNSDGVITRRELNKYSRLQEYIQQHNAGLKEMPECDLRNHSYGPHWRNKLDFWKAESDKPTPVLVFFHGGGFTGGDKSKYYGHPLAVACLEDGISIVTANYRYMTQSTFPGPFLDAARVIQYLRANAEHLGIDPDKIAAAGGSAGANMALWLAVHDDLSNPNSPDPVLRQSSRLTTVLANAAQTSNDPLFWLEHIHTGNKIHSLLLHFYGLPDMKIEKVKKVFTTEKYSQMAFEASSVNHISEDDPPVLLKYSMKPGEWNEGKPMPPDTRQSKYAHHVAFGRIFKEKYEQKGLNCVLRARSEISTREELNWLNMQFERKK